MVYILILLHIYILYFVYKNYYIFFIFFTIYLIIIKFNKEKIKVEIAAVGFEPTKAYANAT